MLEDKNNWLELGKIRNNIAHQYQDEPKQTLAALNAIYNAESVLETMYLGLKRFNAFRSSIFGESTPRPFGKGPG